ncbi:hypothetical protein B0H10DRAFT_1773985 [Mycena sp. CBHHK59/15]|nr:hypothetical protein B0H10DRAFT_1773985 [Mycena sp. CBHHK59/15]
MQESYCAGLLCWHQFCNREDIPESACMPADHFLLAAFIANAIETCTGKCICNWLNRLRLWDIYNDTLWHDNEGWLPALKKSANKGSISFKRPPRSHYPLSRTDPSNPDGPRRNPVLDTPAHMCGLRASLDLDSPLGAASWSAVLSSFCGCHCVSELLNCSAAKFSSLRDTCHSTHISSSVVNRGTVRAIHLIWTKMMGKVGSKCFLTTVQGTDTDLCPVWAWENHIPVNHSPLPDTPLFAFHLSLGWQYLTKNAVFKAATLDLVFGHSYPIGGSLE